MYQVNITSQTIIYYLLSYLREYLFEISWAESEVKICLLVQSCLIDAEIKDLNGNTTFNVQRVHTPCGRDNC